MSSPTQEQIDEALRHAYWLAEILDSKDSAAVILAAAYREKCEELARAKETYAQRIAREYSKQKP